MRYSIITIVLLAASHAHSENGFHHHEFKVGEVIRYEFEDSDTSFAAVLRDGTIQAGESTAVQEIRIPVAIELLPNDKSLKRKLTISPLAQYRTGRPEALAGTPFQPLTKLAANIPPSFAYSYKDDADALSNLQKTFDSIRGSETGSFLFFKMQDVHQMQGSTQKIPEGMTPGQTHFSPGHETSGLGGKFISAPEQLLYQGTEVFDGIRSGYFKSISLGHQFSIQKIKTYTNFSYSLHVALEGPYKGLLLFGEGQETATVLEENEKGDYKPAALLQRQFSIRLLKAKGD